MATTKGLNVAQSKEKINRCSEISVYRKPSRFLVISGLVVSVTFAVVFHDASCNSSRFLLAWKIRPYSIKTESSPEDYPTNISHLAFAIQGTVKTYNFKRAYVEAWWKPNKTRGYVYLDTAPTGKLLLWSTKSPDYRINDNLSQLFGEIKPRNPVMPSIVHGIFELLREEHEGIRWIISGYDDTVFFVDNLVDVLSKYDHTKYYYIGYPSEFVWSNYRFGFNMAFGGGAIFLSYPLAKALVRYMDRCLRKYATLSADVITMSCLADIGVDLTPHKGAHLNDLTGDYSGFLSSHPKELVLSIHHWDKLDPIFPKMNRSEAARHLMKAGNLDQSRLFQQTICHHRKTNWTFSISWGYSSHIYEKIMHRSWLMNPIETFCGWSRNKKRPLYIFNTRWPFGNPCEAPHIFFFESTIRTSTNEILTIYERSAPRNLSSCAPSGNFSAEFVSKIHVFSPATKRLEIHRAECCDVVSVMDTGKAEVRFRECSMDEIIA